jgi:hypothetical protein
MISISSLTVFIIGLSLHFQNPNTVLITVLLLLNGFVASSRLEMAHTNTEMGCFWAWYHSCFYLFFGYKI